MPLAYWPEDKQRLPEDAEGDVRPRAHATRSTIYLKAPFAAPKLPRGMEKIGTVAEGQLLGPDAARKVGWTEYLVTDRALAIIEATGLKLYRAHYYD